jgi:outer membrane receptor for ferrienterochelin and colicins
MSYKWNNNDKTTALRLSFGTGYRVVNVFTEDHAALTGARDVVFNEDILPEKSWNLNINWTHKIYSSQGFLLDFDSSMFKTVFSNRILPDFETNPNQIIYENLKGSSTSQGVTLNLNSTFANGFRVGVGATYIDSYVSENGIRSRSLLTEQFSGNYKLSYSFNPRFKTDVTGVLIGPMKLPLLGVLDPRPSESPMIHIINLQMTHQFSDFEIYAGVKNLLDFTPDPNSIARAFDPFDEAVEFDGNGQVIPTGLNPNALSFDPSYVFYSNQGLRTFIGFRYSID